MPVNLAALQQRWRLNLGRQLVLQFGHADVRERWFRWMNRLCLRFYVTGNELDR